MEIAKIKSETAVFRIEIENYINDTSDIIIRQIITERVLKCKTWQGVAMALGGGNTADSVRQMYNRHFSKIGS